MKRTVIMLTLDHYGWLKTQAAERGCTLAQVVRDLIRDAMRGEK